MNVSAYSLAIGVKQRLLPYDATIRSALGLCVEHIIVFDPRFDDPGIFTEIDPRVRVIEHNLDFGEWDFINNALTRARRECIGDWCFALDLDQVLHEDDTGRYMIAIERAESRGNDGVRIRGIDLCQDYINPNFLTETGNSGQRLSANRPYIYHKTSEYMIKYIDSQFWEGKAIRKGFDDFAAYDERTGRWFFDPDADWVIDYAVPEKGSITERIEQAVAEGVFIWHYAWYNYSRKSEQGRQLGGWLARTFGRSGDFDIAGLITNLNEQIVLNEEVARKGLKYEVESRGKIKVKVNHPKYVKEWLKEMTIGSE